MSGISARTVLSKLVQVQPLRASAVPLSGSHRSRPLPGGGEVIKSVLWARHSEGAMASGALGEWGNRLGARVGEFSASIHFLTRLPLPRHDGPGAAGANLAQAVW